MHRIIIIDGEYVVLPDDDGDTINNLAAGALLPLADHVNKTFQVSLKPAAMADFIDAIQKWCKHNK